MTQFNSAPNAKQVKSARVNAAISKLGQVKRWAAGQNAALPAQAQAQAAQGARWLDPSVSSAPKTPMPMSTGQPLSASVQGLPAAVAEAPVSSLSLDAGPPGRGTPLNFNSTTDYTAKPAPGLQASTVPGASGDGLRPAQPTQMTPEEGFRRQTNMAADAADVRNRSMVSGGEPAPALRPADIPGTTPGANNGQHSGMPKPPPRMGPVSNGSFKGGVSAEGTQFRVEQALRNNTPPLKMPPNGTVNEGMFTRPPNTPEITPPRVPPVQPAAQTGAAFNAEQAAAFRAEQAGVNAGTTAVKTGAGPIYPGHTPDAAAAAFNAEQAAAKAAPVGTAPAGAPPVEPVPAAPAAKQGFISRLRDGVGNFVSSTPREPVSPVAPAAEAAAGTGKVANAANAVKGFTAGASDLNAIGNTGIGGAFKSVGGALKPAIGLAGKAAGPIALGAAAYETGKMSSADAQNEIGFGSADDGAKMSALKDVANRTAVLGKRFIGTGNETLAEYRDRFGVTPDRVDTSWQSNAADAGILLAGAVTNPLVGLARLAGVMDPRDPKWENGGAPAAPKTGTAASPKPAAPSAETLAAHHRGQGFVDPRRLDLNPASADLGASRDMTNELSGRPDGRMPQLPTDLRQGVVHKTVDAQGRVTYSGRNIAPGEDGLTQMVDGTGRSLAMRGTVDSGTGPAAMGGNSFAISADPRTAAQAAQRQAGYKAALTNPNGSQWTERDNATMASNLRDGVSQYAGTSRDTTGGGGGTQGLLQRGEVGYKQQEDRAIQRDTIAASLRGHELNYQSSMANNAATNRYNALKMNQDLMLKNREFDQSEDHFNSEQKLKANAQAQADIASRLPTKDGKPDNDLAAQILTAQDQMAAHQMDQLSAHLAKNPGDATARSALAGLKAKGRSALGEHDLANSRIGVDATNTFKSGATPFYNPFGGTDVDSNGRAVTSLHKQPDGSYVTNAGAKVPAYQINKSGSFFGYGGKNSTKFESLIDAGNRIDAAKANRR